MLENQSPKSDAGSTRTLAITIGSQQDISGASAASPAHTAAQHRLLTTDHS
jgi:hypothetical protein